MNHCKIVSFIHNYILCENNKWRVQQHKMREQLFPLLRKACRLTSEGLCYFTIYTNAIAAGTKLVENLGDDLATGNGARKWGSVNSSQRQNEENSQNRGRKEVGTRNEMEIIKYLPFCIQKMEDERSKALKGCGTWSKTQNRAKTNTTLAVACEQAIRLGCCGHTNLGSP